MKYKRPFATTVNKRRVVPVAFLFSLLPLVSAYSQWTLLHHCAKTVFSVYVIPPDKPSEKNIILAGFEGTNPPYFSGLDISLDDGETWQAVNCPGLGSAPLTFAFENRLHGWMGQHDDHTSFADPSVFETTDGGLNWQSIYPPFTTQNHICNAWGLYWNSYSRYLFVSDHLQQNLLRTRDGGVTWDTTRSTLPTNFVFKNANVGIVLTWNGRIYYTLDQGNTWQWVVPPVPTPYQLASGTPALMPDSNTFVVADEYGPILISQDSGRTWHLTGSTVDGNTGNIVQSGGKLYTNTGRGIVMSTDTGYTWEPFCGPAGGVFPSNAISIVNGVIYYGDINGNIWVNHSGLTFSPRFFLSSSPSDTETRIALRTLAAFWNGFTADSVSVRLVFNTKAFSEKSVSLAPGWSVSYVESLADGARFHFVRKSANIETDSTLATITFQTYVSPDTSPTIALDEINWDRDTTFRDCMASALSVSDTVRVKLQLSCEDSVLLRFMATGSPFRIENISPNPFSISTSIRISSHQSGAAHVRVVNLFGEEVARLFDGPLEAGEHSFTWRPGIAGEDAPRQAGVYWCEVRMSGRVERVPMMVVR